MDYIYGPMKSGAAFIFGSANVQSSAGGLQKFVYGAQKIGSAFVYASNSVPILAQQAANIIDTVTFGKFGVGAALSGLIGSSPVKWGIFNTDGEAIALADTVLSVEYTRGSRISNYPVEEGAFAAYNKVQEPLAMRVALVCGGSETVRADFILALDDAEKSIDLFNILLPETSYFNMNVERVDWRRTVQSGAGVVVAEIYLTEVRESAMAEYSSPISSDAEDFRQQGQLRLAPPDISDAALTRVAGFV